MENVHGRDEVTYSVEVKVPPQPPVLAVVDSYADSLHLQWSDQGDGGSPILGMTTTYSYLNVYVGMPMKLFRLEHLPKSQLYYLHYFKGT